MTIQTGVILEGGTVTFAAGTAKTLATDGVQVNGGVHVCEPSVTDFRARPGVSFKTVQPTLASDGTWNKGNRQIVLTIPKVLASGKQGFPCVRIKLEDFPEMTQAEVDRLRNWASQVVMKADFDAFWRTGALS